MTIDQILKEKQHRPWALPLAPWNYYQEWNEAIFLHWQVDFDTLRKLVPETLEIDLFDGKPWVSIVAFTMEKIRPRFLPAFKPISNFHEVNIRTYVKKGEKTGVYFLSIEGGKTLSCKIAKGASGLPYRYSTMVRKPNFYQSENVEFGDQLEIEFKTGKQSPQKTPLDLWLTERYALLQDVKNKLVSFDIHHPEWITKEIEVKQLNLYYPRFGNFFKHPPDKVQYSPGVQVVAWGSEKL